MFVETLQRGVTEGRIVLRFIRPDRSEHTYWREPPSTEDFARNDLEIVPIEHAKLHNLSPDLLRPKELPELWEDDSTSITVEAIREFFGGDEVPNLASDEILSGAIRAAVETGFLMARHQDRAYLKEAIPDTVLSDDLELFPPLARISGSQKSARTLSQKRGRRKGSSVGKAMDALAASKGMPIPWQLVVDAVNDGVSKALFEITEGSATWPCSADNANQIGLQVSQAPVTIDLTDFIEVIQQPFDGSGEPTLGWIKEKLDSKKGASIPDDVFRNAVQKASDHNIITCDRSINR